MIGKEFPSEIKDWKDEKTGNIGKQLTSDGSNNFHFYFTDNSFTHDDQEIFFLSDRSSPVPNIFNLFKMNLTTGIITQLTDEELGIEPSFHTKTKESDIVVYVTGNLVKKLDMHNLQTEIIYKEKTGIKLGHPHISCDRKYVGMARNESVPVESGANYLGFKETMYATKKGWITLISLDGNEVFNVHEDTHWLGHFQFSPINSSLAIFCHEGPWNLVQQRIWLLDIRSRSPSPIFRQEENDCIGHEFWTNNGYVFFDNRREGHDGTITVDKKQATIESKGTTEQAPYVGFVDSKGQMVKVVELPFYCNHYHANNDHTLLVGDGVEDLVLINISGNKGEMEVLCSHNTSWNTQQTHCHPTFSYNNEQILFTSDREGVCNLYLIDIPK